MQHLPEKKQTFASLSWNDNLQRSEVISPTGESFKLSCLPEFNNSFKNLTPNIAI